MTLYTSPYKGRPSRTVGWVAVVIDFLLVCFSGSMMGLGIWLVAENLVGVLSTVLPHDKIWDWLAYGMIATGVVLMVTCSIGIHGFMREKRPVLILHCFLLVLCFFGVALFVGLPFWYKEEVKKDLYNNMDDSLFNFDGETGHDDHSVFWNYVQAYSQCCGVDSEQDYQYVKWHYTITPATYYIPTLGNVTRRFPASCCKYYNEYPPSLRTLQQGTWHLNGAYLVDCYLENPDPNPPYSFTTGCYRQVRNMLITNMNLMGSIAVVICAVLILVFMMGLFVIAANTEQEI